MNNKFNSQNGCVRVSTYLSSSYDQTINETMKNSRTQRARMSTKYEVNLLKRYTLKNTKLLHCIYSQV